MPSTPSISSLLADVLSGRPTRAHTHAFIICCRRIATAYLRQKQRQSRLAPAVQHLDLEDLALDAIAPLFERDDHGIFIQLARYYDAIGWQDADENTLFEATRRLVFSAVNDHLFDLYGQADPSLSNLLRNLKRAITNTPGLTLERRAGTLWLQVTKQDNGTNAVLMPPEFLEAHLTPAIRQGTNTPHLLKAAVAVLAEQSRYAPGYPLTRLALILRSAIVRVTEASSQDPSPPDRLYAEDIARCIDGCIATTQDAMRATYVGKGKVDDHTFKCYFHAIRDRLVAQYVQRDGHALTNYKALCTYLPTLSREAYGQDHRPIFEYLAKCTRERLVTYLRTEP